MSLRRPSLSRSSRLVRQPRRSNFQFSQRTITVQSTKHHTRPGYQVKLLKVLLGITMVTVIIALGVFLVFFRRNWSDKTMKNIVIVPSTMDRKINQIILAHIDVSKPQLSIMTLPAEKQVAVIGGYGQYPLRSVFNLLRLDHQSSSFLTAAYSQAIGTVVDEVWTAEEASAFTAATPLSAAAFISTVNAPKLNSSLTVADKVWFSRWFVSLKGDQLISLDSESATDTDQLQKNLIKFQFEDRPECAVAVLNSTGKAGLATRVSKVLEQSGFTIIRIADRSPQEETSSLLMDPAHPCLVSDHIQSIFPEKIKIEKDADIFQKYRANVVIIIGKDAAPIATQ